MIIIDGTMTTQERERQIQDFTDSEDKNVFIISLQAGALGLNLVAANHVLIFDPWWNPAVENQAADRCYRIGQQKEVYVKNFICTGTIEERILELQNQKKKLIDNTINKNAAYFNYQQNKEEDMKYLFDLDQNID
ncbi:P-loop containing nucleoside triphosphate hydrolase [Pseudocohnilembus persalinus]|uniref:p-loop containing nucleoside triphosphate hydrolase n=1 Tax=Pseudocohnilembus persalinus TaxID=266149 RepID=A0A0V0Q7Z3_PSEPJ|nr:P-loop containing nucleoside triphosphate hydrolase [Pseudocohnilembus persalinus]|eukprot:KRW98305.1 P-loop containing nucleoside triphosphate hydrolase [Pseudocohnilembus persalinus]